MQSIQTQEIEDDPIEEDKAEMALHVLKTATAVGIGLWSPGDLRSLPKKALRALAQILRQVEQHAIWPSYLLYNISVLM
eukprot:6793293-Karenia_brevis.AAC.1